MNEKYAIKWSSRFKKDYKKMIRRGKVISKLDDVIRQLALGQPLPVSLRDHALTGSFAGHRECHLAPDWLLIYQICENVLVLELTRTGSHADLLE